MMLKAADIIARASQTAMCVKCDADAPAQINGYWLCPSCFAEQVNRRCKELTNEA